MPKFIKKVGNTIYETEVSKIKRKNIKKTIHNWAKQENFKEHNINVQSDWHPKFIANIIMAHIWANVADKGEIYECPEMQHFLMKHWNTQYDIILDEVKKYLTKQLVKGN